MSRKRMFDKSLLETDAFMDMPMPTKALYFLLGMEADDEGFVSPKRVMRIYGGNEDDLKVLIAKNYVIQFKSGVIVITDWNENNYLDKNRMKETKYKTEKKLIILKGNKYAMLNKSLTDVYPEERSIEEKSIEEIATRVADPVKMDLEGFKVWCSKSPRRQIQIIGEWADTSKPGFTTKEQWEVFLKRNLRAANDLSVFTDEQIEKAYSEILKGKGEGWLKKATLETILKFLN
jgi:hypothetical protein